jgi:hypothetical protein
MAEDIHQARFALISVLRHAYEARPNEYADSDVLQAMNDERLIAYALGLLDSLERRPHLMRSRPSFEGSSGKSFLSLCPSFDSRAGRDHNDR